VIGGSAAAWIPAAYAIGTTLLQRGPGSSRRFGYAFGPWLPYITGG